MNESSFLPLIAVDIGNSRIKFGLFTERAVDGELPMPTRTFAVSGSAFDADRVLDWTAAIPGDPFYRLASVNRRVRDELVQLFDRRRGVTRQESRDEPNRLKELSLRDLPLKVAVEQPERVGIDRLLGAVGANRLRESGRPAIVVDAGSAITVNLVGADGAFLGGAILPGIGMSLRALHEFTDALPQVSLEQVASPPAALGKATAPAIQAGVYWGAVGAVRELIGQFNASATLQGKQRPQVFVTGGAGKLLVEHLKRGDAAGEREVVYVPHLLLGAIAVVAGI